MTLPVHTNSFLAAASRIGDRIVGEAFWHEGRCNWVGAEPVERHDGGTPPRPTSRALGPDLYSGTSGIGLFLAELYSLTGEIVFRKAAKGALLHALAGVDSIPPRSRLGLFTGWTGIALIAIRAAIILRDPELEDEGRRLLLRLLVEQFDECEFDIISGRAGAIAALLVLNVLLGDSALIDFALHLGYELLGIAKRSDEGMSWRLTAVQSHRDLTGYSHGTAGAACSLLDLYSVTGAFEFKQAALEAFGYERRHFNAAERNWPDFRTGSTVRSTKRAQFPCLCYWCHGAPGIALSRIRAYEVLNDQECKAEAMIALETTRKSIGTANSSGTGNYSLCHGICGNAEALFYGSRVFGDRCGSDLSVIHNAALSGIEQFLNRETPWPCGTHGGETPGFMLGLSGIGHHLLRLHDSSVPAISILRKEDWLS